ncbi:hypothetical protein IHE49_04850 [Rhodanobacter sp. 7MK24]|uniref:hypothetical protein n=1 Tax=Rhodanobacter sp. 7MK24 TaxID=2775922 RepID=UPI00177A7BB2|nr:hypothetical protein [Rhodanobacter sp. 7MK24]MBD8879800.1 hypothetical protein [Rhodanobacter sp. 7MK24]
MALPYATTSQAAAYADYDWVAVLLFRRLTANYTVATLPPRIPFSLDDVRDAAEEALRDGLLKKGKIRNIADIKYSYDARRDFPAEMMQAFPITWLSSGKGQYFFRKTIRKNIIDLQSICSPLPQLEYVVDQTPIFNSKLMGKDEQAVFARARYAGIFNQILGFQANPVQGHHRTSVGYGQVEVDEVQAGLEGQLGVIVPISGKGGQDRLSWSQVLNLNTYGAACLARYGKIQPPLTGAKVRSLCLWMDKVTAEIWVVEFSDQHSDIDLIDIVQVRRFKFV